MDLTEFRGSPGEFHALDLLAEPVASVVVCEPDRDALVLGSSQSQDIVDTARCQREGVEVVRRRSGGGAVLVERGGMTWFDVVVPAADARATDDVVRSMVWLGERISAALASLGLEGASVHDAPMSTTPWSRLVCFAGVGAGEVLVGGMKFVGISQRRGRTGARFQCMVHASWNPRRLVGLLRDPRPSPDELPGVAVVDAAIGAALPAAVARFLDA
jgi:lipoate-protein ligase A